MLDVSQIETGKLSLESAEFELRSMIDRVIQSLQLQFSSKGQHITIEMEQSDLRVRGDANRVFQILTNLLSNAYKYTPADGSIRLSAHMQEAFVRIAVCDNGVGMTQEEQGRLFTRFYRAKNRLTQTEGGTGLGLIIARSLIELHGGTIWVESAPGKGTTFFFTLPLAADSRQGQDIC
jgi:signal transduction histidine kinase